MRRLMLSDGRSNSACVEFIDENGEGLECASGSRLGSKTTNRRLCATAARRASRKIGGEPKAASNVSTTASGTLTVFRRPGLIAVGE